MPILHSPSPALRKRGRPAKGSPLTRDAVLGAAMEHFACSGFEGTALRDIAQDAGVDAALICHHFGSKLDLWKAVVDEIAVRLGAARHAILDLQDSDQPSNVRVRAGLSNFISANCNVPEFASFLSDGISSVGERRDYIMHRIWDPYQEAMLPLLREAQTEGFLRQGNPELTLMMVMGAIMLPLMMIRPGGAQSLQDLATLKVRLVKNVIPMFLHTA
ncbi:TetR/AcrR family transcriptional regulator [Acetobacter fallax]|uniref:TetR family transcriptional regulator n=1 Tax=Acetobacter fallax TaxID=1737473 RepID=A0ABX0KEY5_9PROT|nr:TetR/AcrR family transcriptional regulator [Acetobacter fallax]NHO32970.1 TetR family transcriptional regulator [Acetobacter fallax]NHO36591.1 TetR family transcriptional regulator [Acetobacter fallax]